MDQLATDPVAASEVDPAEDPAEVTGAAEEQPSLEGDMYPEDASEPEGVEGEENPDEPEGEPDEPAIEPPHSWKAEDKERWANIPREAQEIIARRETEVARLITDKGKEVEQAKTETVTQAAQEIAAFRDQQAQTYLQLAAQIMPQEPDQRLLYSDDPQHHVLYNQQRAIWESAVAQQQRLQLAAQHEAAEAQRIQQDLEAQAKAADDAKLREAFPEWFDDGETGKKLQSELKSAADELGYSELWEQRNAADVLALRKVAEWRADARRWQSYDRNRRNPNGTYKAAQRQLPPVTKPGSAPGNAVQSTDPVKLLYPND
ncbi:MAG: hypothetical protein J7500_15750 [Sphingomonas sp.]|uniref:hypothetical protein n=1 Tax=Sphingomonas sp. TaxID=28214 RepID=UPI001B2A50DA|nr:hypothetical protein [Sphingomonas sp.]MBO9624162.1 hypothetical protein [Sphingomonas sp.]